MAKVGEGVKTSFRVVILIAKAGKSYIVSEKSTVRLMTGKGQHKLLAELSG